MGSSLAQIHHLVGHQLRHLGGIQAQFGQHRCAMFTQVRGRGGWRQGLAIKQREDIASLNASLEKDLSGKGLAFNGVDNAKFREKLAAAGFYKEWQEKFGPEAWGLLEKYAGKVS